MHGVTFDMSHSLYVTYEGKPHILRHLVFSDWILFDSKNIVCFIFYKLMYLKSFVCKWKIIDSQR